MVNMRSVVLVLALMPAATGFQVVVLETHARHPNQRTHALKNAILPLTITDGEITMR